MSTTSIARPHRRRLIFWLAAVAFFPLSVLLFHQIENWRGERAWADEKERLQAAGISLAFEDYLSGPADVPAEQNVAAASIYQRAFDPGVASRITFSLRSLFQMRGERLASPEKGTVTAFAEYQAIGAPGGSERNAESPEQAALRVLAVLAAKTAELEEIRVAAARSYVRFPIDWLAGESAPMNHLNPCIDIARLLALRSCAHVSTGRADKALDDWRLLLRQGEIARNPSFFAHLAEITIITHSFSPVWQGLAQGAWTDAQLAEIESAYGRMDMAKMALESIQGEFCFMMLAFDRYAKDRRALTKSMGYSFAALTGTPFGNAELAVSIGRILAAVCPSGWIRQNQVSQSLVMRSLYHAIQTSTTPAGLFKPVPASATGAASASRPEIYRFLSDSLMPTFEILLGMDSQTTASLALARTAIRLEQHRRTHGGVLPASLADLSPPPPPDPITGHPFGYSRLDDTRFKLWSVALNGIDDHGSTGSKSGIRALDWPWLSYVVPPTGP